MIEKIFARMSISRLLWFDLKNVGLVSTTFGYDRITPIDLTEASELLFNVTDHFIYTQVFSFIYDFQKAIVGAHRIQKPGGVLLLKSASGISHISRYDADRLGHYRSFYTQGIGISMKNAFSQGNVEINHSGNSLSSIFFLKDISMEELTKKELDFIDTDYPVSITIIAKKV